jgi:hypothetical protein
MKTFYFNTGVVISRESLIIGHLMLNGEISRNGTVQIPFDCEDVPENAIFVFACNNPNLPESKNDRVIVREIHNSGLLSKYAYFKLGF